MQWTDLGIPCPRTKPERYTPINWPDGKRTQLPVPDVSAADQTPFAHLVSSRRSGREFSELGVDQLSSLMWMTCKTQQLGSDDLGFPISRRPCPSAGAIHPIHVLIVPPDGSRWYRYDSLNHAVAEVPSRTSALACIKAMHAVLSAPSATLLVLAAEPGMTEAKYDAADSLIWRDAGVLIGYLSMAAQAMGLNFCPLGVTGEPWVSQLIDQPGLTGVGTAFVGSRPL